MNLLIVVMTHHLDTSPLHILTHTSHTHTPLQKNLYTDVVDDVIRNMKDEFLNEGVDEQVLEELKQVRLQ